MEFSRAGIAAVAAICVTAGAGAGYLAMRGASPTAAAESAWPLEAEHADGHVSQALTVDGVEQSEGVIAEAPPLPAPARAAAALPAPVVSAAPRTAPRVAVPAPPPPAPAPAPEPLDAETEIIPIVPALLEQAPPDFHLAAPIAPPAPDIQEIELAVDSVIGLQVETAVSSETAAVEDEVVARVTRDVKVGGHVAIPAGSTAHGEVTSVERGGKVRERAHVGVRFTSLVLTDGTHIPIATETIYREGDAPGRESATKIGGGAIGGAIIGGILGGAKGAAIGGSIGAGAGSAAVLAGGRNPANLSAGSSVTIRLQEPARILLEK